MKKKFPIFSTDAEAEEFVAKSDLTEYDASGFQPARFEFEAKNAKVNMRIPESLLIAVHPRSVGARGFEVVGNTSPKALYQRAHTPHD